MEQSIKNKFGLRLKKTGKLLSYHTQSNTGDTFCSATQYILDGSGDSFEPLWLVESKELAEYVRMNSTAWYNSSYETPRNRYNQDDLEVVQVDIVVHVEKVEVRLPNNIKDLWSLRKYLDSFKIVD